MSLQDQKRFDPTSAEPRIMQRWLDSGIFHAEPEGPPSGESRRESPTVSGPEGAASAFSIAIPPPNVTGALHMGHALNGSIQDTLIRYHRARGKRVRWTLGTDHAGIATQTQVEKRLISEGTSREQVGREEFIRRTWEWREEFGGTIIGQFQRLGCSCDYSDERFTLDDEYHAAVLKVFVDLYNKGYVYRDLYLVNWDPGSQSAISDLEVENREVTDTLYEIAYPLTDGSGELVVATVRPETMLADVAVAVHPDDERYAQFVGKTVRLPLTDRELPVIADEYVKTDFGTGALKITPGHDPNDFEIGRKHGLPELTVIGEDGRLIGDCAGRFQGLPVLEAREQVVAALEAEHALRGTEPYTHEVPYSHRSGERIEPLISLQWFMRMEELAKPAIEVVREGKVRIHPPSQERRYIEWLENIRPWCISRQLWWGHQIPVWYRDEEVHCGVEPPQGEGWEQDPDVLDTWFSSQLWPFATLGWPDDTPELRTFYPTDVLSTARDILFLWVARMVMMGLEFTGEIPFRDVYNHSVIQAPDGRRMSKSLGTGIDPLALIEGGERPPVFGRSAHPPGDFPAYGADAVRFGLLAMSSTQDVRFSEEKVAQGAALVTKLFNATRFVLGAVGEAAVTVVPSDATLEDRWIVSRLQAARTDFESQIGEFDFSKAALGLYDVVFGELCDWYIEFSKARLAGADPALLGHLVWVLRETLLLAHPIIPFVTEELWSHLPAQARDADLLAGAQVSALDPSQRDQAAEHEVAGIIEAITSVRSWRDGSGVKPGEVLEARVSGLDGEAAELLARMARLDVRDDDREAVATVPAAGVVIELLTGVNAEEVAAKAAVERERLQGEIARIDKKLSNEGFVAKAPAEVVDAEREKRSRYEAELQALGGA